MANISEEKWIEILEKKSDGSFVAKYPKVKSKTGLDYEDLVGDIHTTNNPNGIVRANSNGKIDSGWVKCKANLGDHRKTIITGYTTTNFKSLFNKIKVATLELPISGVIRISFKASATDRYRFSVMSGDSTLGWVTGEITSEQVVYRGDIIISNPGTYDITVSGNSAQSSGGQVTWQALAVSYNVEIEAPDPVLKKL